MEATLSNFNTVSRISVRANLSNLSGFKSAGAVKGVRGGVRTDIEGVMTHQHLARIGVTTF